MSLDDSSVISLDNNEKKRKEIDNLEKEDESKKLKIESPGIEDGEVEDISPLPSLKINSAGKDISHSPLSPPPSSQNKNTTTTSNGSSNTTKEKTYDRDSNSSSNSSSTSTRYSRDSRDNIHRRDNDRNRDRDRDDRRERDYDRDRDRDYSRRDRDDRSSRDRDRDRDDRRERDYSSNKRDSRDSRDSKEYREDRTKNDRDYKNLNNNSNSNGNGNNNSNNSNNKPIEKVSNSKTTIVNNNDKKDVTSTENLEKNQTTIITTTKIAITENNIKETKKEVVVEQEKSNNIKNNIIQDETLIIDEEDEKAKEERLLEESRLRRQRIKEKYEEEQRLKAQEQQQQQEVQPKVTAPEATIVVEQKNDIKKQQQQEDEDENSIFDWRKENNNNNNNTSTTIEEDQDSCSSEEDLKKRGIIDEKDLKHKTTTTTVNNNNNKKDEKKEKKKDDDDDDILDMFSDSPDDGLEISIVNNSTTIDPSINLTDNWDDADGYYKYKVGEIINQYQVVLPIGSGVFSTVVSAKNIKTNEDVVIKIIRNRPSMNRSGVKEIDILSKISNNSNNQKTHCIQMKDSFTFRNHLCIVFEPMSMSLHQLIKKFGKNIGLSLNAVRVYAKQLFIALKHIKNAKIIHADIKPDNIVVNESKNTIKIIDFGSAGETHESEITPYLVSRFYRAPEIILGNKYDYAIDVWSVGCCLAELFTGKFLFPGRTNNDMIRLFIEYKGPFPRKMLKKSQFLANHFNENFVFLKQEHDPVSKNIQRIPYEVQKPVKDFMQFLMPKNLSLPESDLKKLQQLKDLIEKCTILDPEKRITPSEALNHDFLKP